MRGSGLVEEALMKHKISREEAVTLANVAADSWGFDKTMHNADNYNLAIGKPSLESTLTDLDSGTSFRGSVRRLYELPLWPNVWFCVHKDPRGFAWGVGFVNGKAPLYSLDVAKVKPWDWSNDALESAAFDVEILEAWDEQRDVRLTFIEGSRRLKFRAIFDFGLLQEWSLESTVAFK
jgi:hypothetical protein